MADATATGGWHQWLWQLRLAQARAELALARNALDDAVAMATEAIEMSRARRRPKYEALGFMTRARSLHAAKRTQAAIADARQAAEIATAIADPSVQLLTLDTLLDLDGTDELMLQARAVSERMQNSLPDDALRALFCASEVAQRVRGRR